MLTYCVLGPGKGTVTSLIILAFAAGARAHGHQAGAQEAAATLADEMLWATHQVQGIARGLENAPGSHTCASASSSIK